MSSTSAWRSRAASAAMSARMSDRSRSALARAGPDPGQVGLQPADRLEHLLRALGHHRDAPG